jgi:hypothetical protein
MKTCVVYAAYVPDSTKINVIREFFSVFKSQFTDADFYIGINPGSISSVNNVIKEYGLNCQFCYAQDNLNTNTDASAYQAALMLLKNTGIKYDTYWFGHTKGGANPREGERKMYIDEFFLKRKEIEETFKNYPMLGSWGIRGNSISAAGVKWNEYDVDCAFPICKNTKIPPFNYSHVNWSYVETLYALKGEPVEAFINALPIDFFTNKLNPWYFETVMPWVPSRCGYFPYVKIKRDLWNLCELTDITKEWINENNLKEVYRDDLQHYLNL